jgi:RHS repeat-associated protein
VTMAYPPEGLRVKKAVGAETTKFVWDEQNYLVEADGSNVTQAVYTNEPQQFGTLVSQRRASTSSYFHFEGLGSTRNLTASNGATSDSYVYDAFGNPVTSSGSTVNPFRFVGQLGYYFDSETGVFYVRRRPDDPKTSRWQSPDPLGLLNLLGLGGDLNLYRYVGNNPVNAIDPSGLWKQINRTTYESEGCEDALQSLASMVTGNYADWVCIWPLRTPGSWNNYPVANAGERADVSNLLATGHRVLMRTSYGAGDLFMAGVAGVFGRGAFVWTSGAAAGRHIRNASRQGARPIGTLVVGGHCGGGTTIGNMVGANLFSAANVVAAATQRDNSNNVFTSAVLRIGPPRCWFTRSAQIYGYACNTNPTWAGDWAAQIARSGSTVFGTTSLVVAGVGGPTAPGPWATMQAINPPPGGTRINTSVGRLLADPAWGAGAVAGTQ